MNYFPFHVGDYAAHTSHLEPMEDLAYRRMLDLYYLREECLPADAASVARLIRMRAHVQDVEAVLAEFFVLTDAGWSHSRCDGEIRRMRERLEASEEKDQHEKDRMQRYRERRAAMFAALRDRGIVPSYDMPMKDLQRLLDEHCNATETPETSPATHLQRTCNVSGDALATAIFTNTNTNTNTKEEERETRKRAPAPTCPDDVAETVWEDFQRLRREKRAPLTETALAGVRREAKKAGVSMEVALAACCEYGWQGFNASWYAERTAVKPTDAAAETPYQRSMRERMQEAVPAIARKVPGAQPMQAVEFFETVAAAPALRIGGQP